jgi:hypothetical protein
MEEETGKQAADPNMPEAQNSGTEISGEETDDFEESTDAIGNEENHTHAIDDFDEGGELPLSYPAVALVFLVFYLTPILDYLFDLAGYINIDPLTKLLLSGFLGLAGGFLFDTFS